MDIFVHLKICEGCGCLWFRIQNQENVYCSACKVKLREFPAPETRRRRGRPSRKVPAAARAWRTAQAGGAA